MCEIYKSIYSAQQTNIKGGPSDSEVMADAFIVSLRPSYTAAVIVLFFLACLMRFSILMLLSMPHTKKLVNTRTKKELGNQ